MLFVRELTNEEGNQLRRSHGNVQMESARGRNVLLRHFIAYQMSKEHIRHVSMPSLQPRYAGGHLHLFFYTGPAQAAGGSGSDTTAHNGLSVYHMVSVQVEKAILEKGIVDSISIETIRVILNDADITYQHTKNMERIQ